jgi:uncharacterized protein (TIGR00255 family)
MIRSMTGFARSEHAHAAGTLAWEIRTVNHRYLELSLRLPEDFRSLETECRAAIAASIKRGKLDATLQFRAAPGSTAGLELDVPFLDELIKRAHEVKRRATSHGGEMTPPSALEMLRWPGVLKEPQQDRAPLLGAALQTLKAALGDLAASRASEGERIAAMLRARCAQLEELVAAIRARLPEVRARIRARLEERLGQLTLPAEPNRERFEQELALALARMDVDEELDRLSSHVAETDKALAGGEPAGRRLDFLMQEFNREANTLSSKSQDAATTRAAVDIKVLIEQMREQIQNVE